MEPEATPATPNVDGIKHGEFWMLSCRACGVLGISDSVGAAQTEARAHIAQHTAATQGDPGDGQDVHEGPDHDPDPS